MKAFTDIEQSKKLAEILPIESADMRYAPFGDIHPWVWDGEVKLLEKGSIPCWSLAALLEIMPYVNNIRPFNLTKMWEGGENNREHVKYVCTYYYIHSTESDNPIDACVEMIVYLKEKGLI